MRKIILGLLLSIFFLQIPVSQVFAQASPSPAASGSPAPSGSPEAVAIPQERPDSLAIIGLPGSGGRGWQVDDEVTFTGKLAARSEDVLDWLLENYQWAKFSGSETPFDSLWEFVRNTVFAVLGLFILVGAFLMIITRGRSLTVKRLIIRFVMVLILVIFSFSIVRTIYALTDIVQGFFLIMPESSCPQKIICTQDLLNVAFGYGEFQGFRRIGPEFNESAITSLLLIKATAATYYTMFIILIIRKVILWFFILVSPVFPLLLFFKPIRNTAKIWIGEFFRWVLYAPLFAIFLRGLVEIWKFGVGTNNATGVPLTFKTDLAGTLVSTPEGGLIYPTAINILLGGPGQLVLGNNNVNFRDTFVLYLVALLMLWMVIILPWILLRIFLDYFNSTSLGDSNLVKFLARNGLPPPGRFRPESAYPPPGSPNSPLTPPPGVTGMAKSLPLSKFRHTPVAEIQQVMQEESARAQQAISQSAMQSGRITTMNVENANIQAGQLLASNLINISDAQSQQIIEALSQAGLSIPTMRDIARIEASSMQKSGPASEEYNRLSELLARVAGTSQLVSPAEKEKFSSIKERLIQQSKQGNAVAKSVVNAASPTVTGSALPQQNQVQQVNLEDYEEVRNTWQENYRKLEPPVDSSGKPKTRTEWLKEELKQIPTVIDLLASGDPARQAEGKRMVSKILPFLLLGGFSNAEIIAYLKAKLEAAKAVLKEILQVEEKREDEETKVEAQRPQQNQKTMSAEAPLPTDEKPAPAESGEQKPEPSS